MNKKKLNELINSYYENNSEEIKREIILNSVVIIDKIIKKYEGTKLDKEELHAILSLELVEGVNYYLQNHINMNYYLYIYNKINYKLKATINKEEKSHIKFKSLDSITKYYVRTTDKIDERIDLEEEIKLALECLNERYRNIIKMNYGIDYHKNYSLYDISKINKTSHQNISQIEKRALELMRKLIELKRNDIEEFEKLHKEITNNQKKQQELNDKIKSNNEIRNEIKKLLKKYENTKDEKIKKEIFDLDKNRVYKLVQKYKYKDVTFDEAYTLISKNYYNFIDIFIELTKTNTKINYFVFTDTLIKDKVSELSNQYMYNKNINNLIYLYDNANDINTKEQILKQIIEISKPKINSIIQRYAYLNIPYEELLNVALSTLIISIEKFFNLATGNFKVYLTDSIIRSLNKYTTAKLNQNESSDEIQKTLKI